MICPKCRRQIEDGVYFCGACGTPLFRGADNYIVYNYSQSLAKRNGAYISFKKVLDISMLIMVPAIISACITPIFEKSIGFGLTLGIPLLSALVGIAAIIWLTLSMATYLNAPQQTIVFDKGRNKYYIVRFNGETISGWNTKTRAAAAIHNLVVRAEESAKAQVDPLSIQAVADYQNNLNQPSATDRFLWGSDLLVIEFNQVTNVKQTQKYTIYEYTDKKDKRKKIRIPNVYSGFKI